MGRLSRWETETVISFNMEEDFAVVATRMQRVKTRLKKHGVSVYMKQGDYEVYRVPVRWIKIAPVKKTSEGQKRAARARFKAMHLKNRSKSV